MSNGKITKDMVEFWASLVDTFLQEVQEAYTSSDTSEAAQYDRIIKSAKLAQAGVLLGDYFRNNANVLLKQLTDEQYNVVRIACLESTLPIAKLFQKKAAEWNEEAKKLVDEAATATKTGKILN